MQAITEAVSRGAGLGAFQELDPGANGLVRIETTVPAPLQPFYLVFRRELRTQPM